MDDLNEIARLHSAGATVRHTSPFENLPTYKNKNALSQEFFDMWVIPYYMKIAKYGDTDWIDSLKKIKNEVTPEVCLFLLGDFNWRTRLVGAYFAAMKGYTEFLDVIGTHLLKSEVCCVGHMYALTLAFFNDEKSLSYLHTYLDYYLTKPNLYFNQEHVMEAVIYLDRVNGTQTFKKYIPHWQVMKQAQKKLEKQFALQVAKLLKEQKGKEAVERYLQSIETNEKDEPDDFTTGYFDTQIPILRHLHEYNNEPGIQLL